MIIRNYNKNVYIGLFLSSRLNRIYIYYHQHVTPPARISLTLSRHSSLLSIAPGRFSRLYPVSVQICCIQDLAGHPAFARPWWCQVNEDSEYPKKESLMHHNLIQNTPADQNTYFWVKKKKQKKKNKKIRNSIPAHQMDFKLNFHLKSIWWVRICEINLLSNTTSNFLVFNQCVCENIKD